MVLLVKPHPILICSEKQERHRITKEELGLMEQL